MENNSYSKLVQKFELPSRGYFYPKSIPFSSGFVTLRYATAVDEEILTSNELIKEGKAMDEFVKSLLVDGAENYFDELIGADRAAVYIAARIVTYGDTYKKAVKCPKCGTEQKKYPIKLSSFNIKPIDESYKDYQKNIFNFVTSSNRKITYKFLTVRDYQMIDKEVKAMQSLSNTSRNFENTLKLLYSIQSIDDVTSRDEIRNIIYKGELKTFEIQELREEIAEKIPDMDIKYKFVCSNKLCKHEEDVPMPIGIDFFWPASNI